MTLCGITKDFRCASGIMHRGKNDVLMKINKIINRNPIFKRMEN